MKNPFKFGTIVEGDYFTDRKKELQQIKQTLESENHLILISPRRFGKTSLVINAIKQCDRPFIVLNLQKAIDTVDFASKLINELFKLFPWERLKQRMRHFRIIPTISTNPITNGVDVSFQPYVNINIVLEDTMALLEKVSSKNRRLIVVFDEFQEIMSIGKGLDKQLRAIMQMQKNINYIILGSQESMMEEIFERKKSPFYHFGTLMRLKKIPYDDFLSYLNDRLSNVLETRSEQISKDILSVTDCHPYYTQEMASLVWELANYESEREDLIQKAMDRIISIHDLDYERLWIRFNRTDKSLIQSLSTNRPALQTKNMPTSTAFSGLKRLMKAGYVIQTDTYEIEDPFFKYWIIKNQI